MSKTVSEFLAESLTRLGFSTEHEGLKSVLAITAQLPDDVTDALQGLMTEREAKQNLSVKNHFLANFGDSIIKNVERDLLEFGIDTSTIEEFKTEKSTSKKMSIALKKLAEAKDALINAKVDKNPEAILKANEQIKAANDQLTKKESEWAQKLAEKDSFLTDYKKKNELAKLISKHQWSDIVPEAVRGALFDQVLNEDMKKLGVVMQLEGDNLVLKQSADPALNFHFQNKEFTPADLIAKVMSDNKLLQVAQPATPPYSIPGFRTPVDSNGGGAKHVAPSAFREKLAQANRDQEVQH